TVRIFTGAPLPEGADCVIIAEDTAPAPAPAGDGEAVRLLVAATAGAHVRPAGLDFVAGAELLPRGTGLSPRAIALAAAGDHARLPVVPRPRVAILSTGDELTLPGTARRPQDIVAATGPALAAATALWGGTSLDLGIVPDRRDALVRTLKDAATRADLLVTLGGASVGAHDLVRDALVEAGGRLAFWKIAMRPGKPLLYGDLDGKPLLGLPGNPVSALICALLFLRPAIARLAGRPPLPLPRIEARLTCPLPANGPRADYMRARLGPGEDGPQVTPFEVQDSSMLAPLAVAGALAIRPPHDPARTAGERLAVIPLDGLL
ncbi:MAG: molybdopterin molybdotransferase MoeA, partial [Alphaproteobacteria bacterium]|nr:molybdopterin molybdotransferase MoeA [Alphaproteobacteria bacterium]